MEIKLPPALGLYIHLPWCEKKCPYCDFNSHLVDNLPEQDYVEALLNDLEQDLPLIWGRTIETIFIGGGTPSLFSGTSIERLFSGLRALLNLAANAEITIESNPGSADIGHFEAYRESGINRLSIGVQSFSDEHLQALGRVHDSDTARQAFAAARSAGFDNINLDLMYGLPAQSLQQALADLQQAIDLEPEHISHYQLTIEPNTLFHSSPPAQMPDDELAWRQQEACQLLLVDQGFQQYEISAYSREKYRSRHNLNYWRFGDYVGIGAGAHGKITLPGENRILRRVRQRQPAAYLKTRGRDSISREIELSPSDRIFEFMLNALRLSDGFLPTDFVDATGMSLSVILPIIQKAQASGLLKPGQEIICPSNLGFQYLNDLQMMFLDLDLSKNQPFFTTSDNIIHS
jgi:putative oxygen-independent coproporphyrinogen III oxidase